MLPKIRGEYVFNCKMESVSFIGTGGVCDVVFYPKDEEDLVHFLQNKPPDLPALCLGNLSNTIISDGGFRGCIIILTRFMNDIEFNENYVRSEAGAMLNSVIAKCIENELSCCERLFLIPGTIGGAVAMNAGVPDFEISDVLIEISCISHKGQKFSLKRSEIDMQYRSGNIPENLIITSATFEASRRAVPALNSIIDEIAKKRISSQPLGQRTLGSTFKNPPGHKAWQLIREAGCSNLKIGQASVCNLHANFLTNTGDATSEDFIRLIRLIKKKVFEKSGIYLEEEIIFVGEIETK
ncbi:MAG: UDP-N-acetylmuramate dehydrogenase [Holosporales bacterium]|jgi:UDP-N-acetylmuramate dehydrogenase|nr:UDP-N-acetylmuramate dehydrogenase [Holosporales bacterium]